ncbi:V-type sodium ATPase subunit C [Carnobacterium sp. 17-4]|uniref:V-type ATP synthase subunit C n=1 Tax=Carnobacterium sp. (strain 17-4) TaxID=208596 RepID=UPI0002058EA5|nr:V-type ATP synthase subunit C [Carnobacterium sp. 17-4]AEB29657.1 V-type sodium ATPase subunit C [Carnobacterium sp. 17-4]
MKSTDFVGANTRIRVYESSLLRNDQYERMLQASNFEEAVNVLKDTPYRNDVEDLKETKNYDTLLMNELQSVYTDLFKITPNHDLIELFSLRYSYHNLKVLLKEKGTKKDFDSLLINIGKDSISALRQAVDTKKSSDLDQDYLISILEASESYEEYKDSQAVDIILDRRFFTHLRHIAEKMNDTKILDLVTFYIDMNNLSTLTRAIRQKRTRNFLTTILSSSGTIPKDQLVQIGADNLVNAGKKLAESKYKNIILASINDETKELSPEKIDLETDNAFINRIKDAKLEVFGPLPIVAYLYAKENEVKNLRLILVGKENNLPISAIRERMRINYGS